MQKKKIKLRYVDTFSKDYRSETLWKLLNLWFDIDEISEPDYVISAGMGIDFTRYREKVLIQIIGENITPEFNIFDYAIGFDYIDFGDRYIRVPLYVFYQSYQKMIKEQRMISKQEACNRGFCSYVVSNNKCADPTRDSFFEALCKYKKVDSAGRHLNNMGGAFLKDKLGFISQYKFNIAFENTSSPGYTTEKIMEPMSVNVIPIYWGNPLVAKDFNKDSFICLSDFASVGDCIEYIMSLDKNNDLYYEKLSRPWLKNDETTDYNQKLKCFFENIFEQEINSAKRVNVYGMQSRLKNELCDLYHLKSIGGYTGLFVNKSLKLLQRLTK